MLNYVNCIPISSYLATGKVQLSCHSTRVRRNDV